MRFALLKLYLLILALNAATSASALEPNIYPTFKGPIQASLIKVIDGDTVLVMAYPWPSQSIRVYVRLRDIDAPELRSKCTFEKQDAKTAKNALVTFLEDTELTLHDISGGKYYGRVIANIKQEKGHDASQMLLDQGLAFPYKDRKKLRDKYAACYKS